MAIAHGRRLGAVHDHSSDAEGGTSLSPDDLGIAGSDLVASGDVLPIATFGVTDNRSASTSSSTFVNKDEFHFQHVRWDRIVPSGAAIVVNVLCEIQPGTDETGTLAWRNASDSEDIVTVSLSGSSDRVESGWTSYTASTTSGVLLWRCRLKTDPGNASTTFTGPTFQLGIQL